VRLSYLIIDDFYDDPHTVRNAALQTDCARFTQEVIKRDSNDAFKWGHVMTIPMRFNRCVLFRPWFRHTSGESFGIGGENARLIQLFFFTLDKPKLHGSDPDTDNAAADSVSGPPTKTAQDPPSS
jgi:hypothetical protein